MAPSSNNRHDELVERIRSVRAELHMATDPDVRSKLHDELGEATKELVELVLERKGRLKSPLE